MSNSNGALIKIRARLRELDIKLWLEPYYKQDVGVIETEIAKLAKDISTQLHISYEQCVISLNELQQSALQKLANRKTFEQSGIATFTVRRVSNDQDEQQLFEIKCALSALGADLQAIIAKKLQVDQAQQVKCIIAGKIINADATLEAQGVRNNQQIMVIISELDKSSANAEQSLYDRIHKIKLDVEKIVDSRRQLFQMEDQDGNPVFMPPEENRALLMALGYCEKARVAMKHQKYDEALILLLEADEKFSTCNSEFLQTVDNYALVNLDIVWCYLLLKNVSQLPDAERRLEICERNFQRSYGANMERAMAIRGTACAERALITRLHLLQGVINFHKNQPNQAWEKLEIAAQGLRDLKVNEVAMTTLIDMGYEASEVRIALRQSANNIERAIVFIQENREKQRAARKRGRKERKVANDLAMSEKHNDWVNPRTVSKLMEMGYAHDVVVEALRRTKNDISAALDILQNNLHELRLNLPAAQPTDEMLLRELLKLGFSQDSCKAALSIADNNLERAVSFLVKMLDNEDELTKMLTVLDQTSCGNNDDDNLPSTSAGLPSCELTSQVLQKVQEELESIKAYERFQHDLEGSAHDYLDLPLIEEEQILIEYQNLLTG